MSFLASEQRPYDALPHPQLPPLHPPSNRLPVHPLSSFDALSTAPAHVAPTAPHLPQPLDRPTAPLPQVGQTRCYWTLLNPDLQFLYLDPVLAHHLAEQADDLIGKSLLTFVHPEEQASAKLDLGSVLESRTLHGSVTRVRYSRLSRVRKQLGYQGSGPDWSDGDKVAVDENYMVLDLVINWASDGLVLCFMHAVVDLTPHDNDEHNKTGWTNWCGTPSMSVDQAQLLYQRLLSAVHQPLAMSRVFQILLNQPERTLWMSWPPEQPASGAPTGPTPKDFAKLAQTVQITESISNGSDAKTSCTRRYKSHQTMHFGTDSAKDVESIFIPHGSIIFACHKVNTGGRPLNPNSVQSSHHQQYYDHPPYSYNLPPASASTTQTNGFPQQASSHYPSANWSQPPDSPTSPTHYSHSQWNHAGSLASGPSVSSVRSSSYPNPPPQPWPAQPPSYLDANPAAASFSQPGAPSGSPYPPPQVGGNEDTPPSPGSDYVPPSRVTHRRGSNHSRDQYGSGGRSTGNPPVGISRCSSCKATHSPEWRKGPSGKKDLCNACGLRYARSRAKKETGTPAQASRRRKDRMLNTLQKDHSPSMSPVPGAYASNRRGSYYEDGSFASTSSNGSPATGEMYPPHAGPSHADYHTGPSPSPSPPGQYGPYSQQSLTHPPPQHAHGDGRAHYSNQGHGAHYYSVPPPAPPHLPMQHGAGQPLPRLEPVPFTRTPPAPSPVSPTDGSPLSLTTASYERERGSRDQEREAMPPSPMPANLRRNPGRGYVATE